MSSIHDLIETYTSIIATAKAGDKDARRQICNIRMKAKRLGQYKDFKRHVGDKGFSCGGRKKKSHRNRKSRRKSRRKRRTRKY